MGKPTILLADDDEDDLLLMRRIFGQLEMEEGLRTVEDGAEAINYLMGVGKYGDRDAYPIPS
jgi:CheY-like chemotaxis protein